MAKRSPQPALTPDVLVNAYANGYFPMAPTAASREIYWYRPDPRAVLPLDSLRVTRSLAKRVRNAGFELAFDQAFEQVMKGCAAPRGGDRETWISGPIIAAYTALHAQGLAHSVEAWRQDPSGQRRLVGGLYGVSLNGAFFGESMFSREHDASKVCLVHLVDHLRTRGFSLLDVQINSPHMASLGTIDIPLAQYMRELRLALALPATFDEGTPAMGFKAADADA